MTGSDTDGSDIGDATHKIGTIFMDSIIDYGTDLIFKKGGTEYMRINSAGRVGIGIDTGIASRLHIKGEGNTDATDALSIQNSDDAVVFRIRDDARMIYSPGGEGLNRVLVSDNLGVASWQTVVKMAYFKMEFNTDQYGEYGGENIADTRTNFDIPFDFNTLLSLELIIIPFATDGSWDINLNSHYGQISEISNIHAEADTRAYSLVTDVKFGVDISVVFNNLTAGDNCGLNITDGLGHGFFCLGIRLKYEASN